MCIKMMYNIFMTQMSRFLALQSISISLQNIQNLSKISKESMLYSRITKQIFKLQSISGLRRFRFQSLEQAAVRRARGKESYYCIFSKDTDKTLNMDNLFYDIAKNGFSICNFQPSSQRVLSLRAGLYLRDIWGRLNVD